MNTTLQTLKCNLLLLCTLGIFYSSSQAQCSWKNPIDIGGTYSNNTMRFVYFTSSTQGWAVSSNGKILSTSNGGSTWSTQTSGTTKILNSVYFTSSTQGWAVGASGTILSTSNGGNTWSAQTSGTISDLNSVYFTSSTQGWAVGASGRILTTSNGGSTWSAQTSGTTNGLTSVYFTSSTQGWAVGATGTILTTSTGGSTWSAQTSGTTNVLYSINFTSSTQGWVVGLSGTILSTSNGGSTWSAQTSGTSQILNSVYFTSSTRGWAVGNSGTILSTSNGGSTWSAQTSGTTNTLYSVHFTSSTQGCAVGVAGIALSTSNGGSTWSVQTSGNLRQLFSVYFSSSTQGWAVGATGTILSTSNGGSTWSVQTSGTIYDLNSVYFSSSTQGWAVGNNGTILSTSNGGSTWSAQTSGITTSLYSVYFTSSTQGWAVGGSGRILTTSNGGSTWSAQTSGTSSILKSVYFTSSTQGWVVGGNGTILSTSNGGSTWSAQTSGTIYALNSVYFTSSTQGWAVSTIGNILTTSSGGSTWSAQTSGTTNWLTSVYFTSSTQGWAVGATGTILSTSNGGSTWSTQTSGSTQYLNSVYLTSSTQGWAVGANGEILLLSCPAPEINLKGNGISIADGDATPSLADSTDFGSTATGSNIIRRYRIVNTGTDTLKISSIVSSGTHASEFVVSGAPSRVLKNDSAIFYVTFTPTAAGARTATITVNNNDANEAAYDFAVTGTGTSAGGSGCSLAQLGINIDGEANSDNSGYSVSLSEDGLTVAIGAPNNAGGGTGRGHVRVYKNISGTWTQQGADIDGEANSDNSGWSVSLSADGLTVAIGSYLNAGGGNQRGHVRVYKYISGAWTQQGADIDGEANNNSSGFSVSLSADGLTLAIGATNNSGGGNKRGHVRVYKNISGTWTQQGTDIDGEADIDQSGYSVSLSADGSTVAIGAPYNAGVGTNKGHVRVYKIISGTWTQQGTDIDGEADNDNSGNSVSLSADGLTVAIGAPYNAGGGTTRGHVRVYKNISGTWTQQGVDIDGEANNDRSGTSVSLSADGLTVAIGAPSNAGGGALSGHVRIYKYISSNWTQQGADIDGEANYNFSGSSVSLSADGIKVAIGAINNAGGGSLRGHVRVYQLSCPAPEITLKGNGISIADGDATPSLADSTDMGSTATGSNIKRRYRIVNTGTDTLKISSIVSSGTHASEFVVSGAPSRVLKNDSAMFFVTFTPTAAGARTATITVNNNDANEAAYDFAVTGTGTSAGGSGCTLAQLGIDIDGSSDDQVFGSSVAISADGSTVAIGTPRESGFSTINGYVRVYKNISGTWTQQGSDIIGEANDDNSGCSVSLSADGLTVAIGAFFNNGGGLTRGHVRVYKFISGTWTQQGADIDGEANGNNSGSSVSLSADGLTVAIGAPYNSGGGTQRGHVRVYKNISGTWTQQGADIDGEANYDQSGYSVSLSADGLTVAIGANINAGGGTGRGHVRVYKIISGTWTQQGADIDGEADNDNSGNSVSLSADGLTVAIGANRNAGGGSYRGHVRVYKNISGTWTQQGTDIDGEANNNLSGTSVSLSADGLTVAIGALQNAGGGTERGHVRVYKYISSSWTQQGADIDGEADDDESGTSVSLSADGLTVAIGAPKNDAGGFRRGHVRVYQLSCPLCKLTSTIPTAAGTYTSTQTGVDGSYTCYCDASNNLLLAIDTTGTRAVVSKDSVKLQIGSTATTSWNNAGGIIGNPNGGVIFNRKWDVKPTTQPTSPVKVKFFFTQAEYDSVKTKLSAMGTTITSPTQFEMYKLFTSGFGDPHAIGATGIVLMNGSTPGLNNWKYTTKGSDHCAEFLVNSFSGGGGGAGAGAIPLPVEFISFTAKKLTNTSAKLNWQTASEVHSNYFEIERSLDGVNFIKIGTVNANGTNAGNYQYLDNTIAQGTSMAYYRINQMDVNGASVVTNIQMVKFGTMLQNVNVYPNPTANVITLELPLDIEHAKISIVDAMGKIVLSDNISQTQNIDLSLLPSGIYTISIQTALEIKNINILKQ